MQSTIVLPAFFNKIINMNAYYNIANNNQDSAIGLVESYGFSPQNTDELADCLQQIVADYGQDGLQKVMYLHPDKTVILELFAGVPANSREGQFAKKMQNIKRGYGSNGQSSTMNEKNTFANNPVSQTSIMILAAAFIMSVAILSTTK